MTRRFSVSVSKLYALCASPAFFRRTGARLGSGFADVRPGGRYRYALDGGGSAWGEYLEVVPGERLALTWSSDQPSGALEGTTLTLTFSALGADESELRLVHDGLDSARVRSKQEEGWTAILGGLAADFAGHLGAALRAGIEPRFRLSQRFARPVAEVFEAFVRPEQIARFFVKSTSGPLAPGEVIEWRFESHNEPFTVLCREVSPHARIRFAWGQAEVSFAFEDLGGDSSRLTIACEGFEPTPEGLADSYSECEGWREVVIALKLLLEHGLRLDAPTCAASVL